MKYLLDTNVISELVSKRPDKRVVKWVDAQDPHSFFLSVITIGEIQKGIEKLDESERKARLQAWLNGDLLLRFSGRMLALDVDVMMTWGAMAGRLDRSGTPMPAVDSLLAAQARHHHCCLVTRNESDFVAADIPTLNPWRCGR